MTFDRFFMINEMEKPKFVLKKSFSKTDFTCNAHNKKCFYRLFFARKEGKNLVTNKKTQEDMLKILPVNSKTMAEWVFEFISGILNCSRWYIIDFGSYASF